MTLDTDVSQFSADGLRFANLHHSYGPEVVLGGLNAAFEKESLVAILGPSGCGKTTLLQILAGLLRPTSGTVLLNGGSPREVRRTGKIGFAFQSPTLLPWRSALDNVLLPLELLGDAESDEGRTYALDLLALVELKGEERKLPRQLSGGMQQRVGLARALVTRPEFLFLDEPFGALDGLTRDKLNEKVRELWQRLALTIFFVTHSVEEAIFLADQVMILSDRPAHIIDVIPIELGNSRHSMTRAESRFFEYQKQIRHAAGGLA